MFSSMKILVQNQYRCMIIQKIQDENPFNPMLPDKFSELLFPAMLLFILTLDFQVNAPSQINGVIDKDY